MDKEMKKTFKRAVLILLIFAQVFSLNAFASGTSESLDIQVFSGASANSYFLIDSDSGDVLSSYNANLQLPMASTTKIMTCIVALENANLSDLVSIPQAAVGVEGSSVYLTKGETLKLEELLYALMLESANDAAVAIAFYVAGGVDEFAGMMNKKAKEIGLESTNFINPHGLPQDNHYSTARDLCFLMQYCMKNEAFRVITSTKSISISAPDGKTRFLSNHNKLLRIYDGCNGGKTGFTKKAGRCLVSSAERDGKELICATLGDPNDWKDHSNLFDYGFSLYSKKEIVSVGSFSYEIPLVGGTRDTVFVSNTETLSLPLRSDEEIKFFVELPKFLYASVDAGQKVGEVIVLNEDLELARIPLVCQGSVLKRTEKLSFWERILQNIRLWFD